MQDAQLRFLQSKPLLNLATGYRGCDNTPVRELDLLVHEPIESEAACSDDDVVPAGPQEMFVQSNAGLIENTHECYRQAKSFTGFSAAR